MTRKAVAGIRTVTALGLLPVIVPCAGFRSRTLGPADAGRVIDGRGEVVSCGLELTDWTPAEDGMLAAGLPADARPGMLLVGGEVRSMAEYPTDGTRLRNRDVCKALWMGSHAGGWNRPPLAWELTHLTADVRDIPAGFEPANAIVNLRHVWDESTVQVSAYDRTTGLMTFASRLESPVGVKYDKGYVIRNIREGMSVAGRWMHDRVTNRVLYRPLPGERTDGFKASVSLADSAFRLTKGADNVTIRNFTFVLGNSIGRTPGLRGINPPGLIDATDAKNLTVEDCVFRDSAGSAIRLLRSPGYRIRNCTVERVGACGVCAVESYAGEVSGCRIVRPGRLCASAIGILAGGDSELVWVQKGRPRESGVTRIVGNEITDTPYCGIVCCGPRHVIASNRVSRVMQVLRDGSAVYTSRTDGALVEGNVVFDDASRTGSRHGIYLDEFCRDTVVRGNVTHDFTSACFCHVTSGIVITGNVFRSSGDLKVGFGGCVGSRLVGNRLVAGGKVLLNGIFADECADNAIAARETERKDPAVVRDFFALPDGRLERVENVTLERSCEKWRTVCLAGNAELGQSGLRESLQRAFDARFGKDAKRVTFADIEADPTAAQAGNPDAIFLGWGFPASARGQSPTLAADDPQAAARQTAIRAIEKRLYDVVGLATNRADVVLMTPLPFDEYASLPDGRSYAGYDNSRFGTELAFAAYHVAYFSKLEFAPVFRVLSHAYARGEASAQSDRLTPSAAAADLAAETILALVCPRHPVKSPARPPEPAEDQFF